MRKERPKTSSDMTTRKPNGGLQARGEPVHPKFEQEAIQLGDSSSIVNLLHAGYHPDAIRTSNNSTALTIAITNNNRLLAQQLLEYGADPNLSVDPSYLHLAISRSNHRHTLEILDLLLSSGALLDSVDERTGRTPLHEAISLGRVLAVKRLLRAGANPNTRDGRMQSPLDLALLQPLFTREALCCLLQQFHADLSPLKHTPTLWLPSSESEVLTESNEQQSPDPLISMPPATPLASPSEGTSIKASLDNIKLDTIKKDTTKQTTKPGVLQAVLDGPQIGSLTPSPIPAELTSHHSLPEYFRSHSRYPIYSSYRTLEKPEYSLPLSPANLKAQHLAERLFLAECLIPD